MPSPAAEVNSFNAVMSRLDDADALRARAAVEGRMMPRPDVNAHIHLPPNFTAFETTAQAVELAAKQGVRVLGASNYYDYSVYGELASEAIRRGIFPLFGIEIITLIDELVQQGVKINDPGNPGKMYLCGKGISRFAPMNDAAQELLQVIRDNDGRRMAVMTDRLAALFAGAGVETGLDAGAVKQRIAARHGCPAESVYLQERHLAQAFQEVLFEKATDPDRRATLLGQIFGSGGTVSADASAVAVQNDIRSHLMKAGKPAFAPDTFVDFDHAYRLILALGGIPSYPTLADGAAPLCPYEASVERLIADLKARGVQGAEFIPVRNSPEVLAQYVHALRDAGLFVTAGTEHNTLDLLPLAPTCANGAPIPDDLQEIFWEGACVVAAHQYLTLRGEPGLVDSEGKPNPAYASNDERIQGFARLGAAVIAQYQEVCAVG